jgi:hypothetical protein
MDPKQKVVTSKFQVCYLPPPLLLLLPLGGCVSQMHLFQSERLGAPINNHVQIAIAVMINPSRFQN